MDAALNDGTMQQSALDPSAAEYVPRRQQSGVLDAPPTMHNHNVFGAHASMAQKPPQQPAAAAADIGINLAQFQAVQEQVARLLGPNKGLTDQGNVDAAGLAARVHELEAALAAHSLCQQQQQQVKPPMAASPPIGAPLPPGASANLMAGNQFIGAHRVGSPMGLTGLPVSAAMAPTQLPPGALSHHLASGAVTAAQLAHHQQYPVGGSGLPMNAALGAYAGMAAAQQQVNLEAHVHNLEQQLKAAQQRVQELVLGQQKVQGGEKAMLVHRINTLEEQLAVQRADSGQSAHTAYNLQLKLAHANNKAKLAEQTHRKELKAAQQTIAAQQVQIAELQRCLSAAESAANINYQLRNVAAQVWGCGEAPK